MGKLKCYNFGKYPDIEHDNYHDLLQRRIIILVRLYKYIKYFNQNVA
jgi:hypothetical protein